MAKKKVSKSVAKKEASNAKVSPLVAFTDQIFHTDLLGIEISVGVGNLLEFNAAKVLPTNEFFNLYDSDWEAGTPRSLVGQYLKTLSKVERESLQMTVDAILGKSVGSGRVSFPFGHTISININNNWILFTNTVKYDIERIKQRWQDTSIDKERATAELDKITFELERGFFPEGQRYLDGGDDPYYRERFYHEHHHQTDHLKSALHVMHNRIEQTLRKIDENYFKSHVHYDTFLMAIGQCVENIIKVAEKSEIENVSIPLIGSGWGGLDSKSVFSTIITYISKSIVFSSSIAGGSKPSTKSSFPKQIFLYLPIHSPLDRAFVTQALQERSLYDGLPEPAVLRTIEIVRLYENEIDAVNDRIEKYQSSAENEYLPSFLCERKKDLEVKLAEIKSVLSKTELIVKVESMTIQEKVINIGNNNTISASVFIADSIENSFNTLAKAPIDNELKSTLEELLRKVAEVSKVVPQEQAEALGRDAETLSKEVASSKPRRGMFDITVDGLKKAATAVGEVGKPILETVSKLLPMLAKLIP